MAKTSCVGGVQWSTEMAHHEMRQEAGSWACTRCGHAADNARVRAAAASRCPVACFRLNGERSRAAEWWMRGLVGMLGLYGRAATDDDVPGDTCSEGEQPPTHEGARKRRRVDRHADPVTGVAGSSSSSSSQRAVLLSAYTTHRLIGAAGCSFCLRCGETPRDNRRAKVMLGLRCASLVPEQEMPARMLALVRVVGPEGVQPLGRPLNAVETERLRGLARQGELLAGRRASWERLLARGGECLI